MPVPFNDLHAQYLSIRAEIDAAIAATRASPVVTLAGTVIVKLALPEFELVVPVANEARAAWTFSVWIAVALGAKFESPA